WQLLRSGHKRPLSHSRSTARPWRRTSNASSHWLLRKRREVSERPLRQTSSGPNRWMVKAAGRNSGAVTAYGALLLVVQAAVPLPRRRFLVAGLPVRGAVRFFSASGTPAVRLSR